MRRLIVFLAVTGTMLPVLMVGLASPATATIRTNETFVLHRDSAGNTVDWSASGTFTDSGTWTDPFLLFAGCQDQTPVCEIELMTVETGSAGTFQMPGVSIIA